MRQIRYISLLLALLSFLDIMPVTAQQQSQYALYNYRNDGDFNAWLNIDIDSITYSNVGLNGIEYNCPVVQEVWTPDSCYRIPLEVIDSISFNAPKPEFKDGIFHITEDHLPYAIGVDDLTATFNADIPSSMLPQVGQVVISDVYDEPFEEGFAGRVLNVVRADGETRIECEDVNITDIFSKLVLVGKGVSVSDEAEYEARTRRKSWSWWEDPIFSVEGQGVFPVKLPKELNLNLLADICSVKSKNPELTVSYYLYLDDIIYSFSADAFLSHKDLTFQVAFKLSDFLNIGNTVSDYMTDFILGRGDEEETTEKWYEHEFDDIKLKIPFQAGPVNFTVELAPIFKLDGDIEIDLINKTSARQHLGFKCSGYTATLLSNPFIPLALSDLNYNYVQDPTRVQQLTLKAEGSATMGLSLQLKANVISKKLLHAAVGAEYDRKASATLQFNLYDTENPISGLYDVIKDSKVKVEDYVKIKGEIGVTPLEILTLKGSFKIPIKTWGEYYIVPHFSKPELPPFNNSPWNFSKPLSLYSAVSKDILLSCKPGLRIEDSNGGYVKKYTSTEEYQYEAAWVHTPLEIDISDLTPNETYRCYPTFSMLGLDPFIVTPYYEFTIPKSISVSPQSISMPVGMEYVIEIRDGWDTFAVVMEEGEDVVSIIHDEETDARHIKVKGEKEGTASLKIEDRRSGQVVRVPITITYAMTLVTSITLSETSLSLKPGDTHSLTATILPEDADNKTVAWKSSDESVATVNENGLVTAIGGGNCVITCLATDGSGVKAECLVTVSSGTTPDPGNHEWVDLGLPSGTLWATCNVGASSPEEYGLYFAWGETQGYTCDTSDGRSFDWASYKWMNAGQSSRSQINKYTLADGNTSACWYSDGTFVGDGLTELLPEDDAATANWGSGWRMPTNDQFEELINSAYTTTEWTTVNGVNGRKITSKVNGNSIFLPAAGDRENTILDYAGSYGLYWSRSLRTSLSSSARFMQFNSGYISSTYGCDRRYGLSVRPVRAQNGVTPGETTTYTVNGVSFTMVAVEGGTFTMGATPEQGDDVYDDEKPAHEVTLDGFSIGETEVTQELWQAVMGSNPSKFSGNKRPVEKVSWYDCQTFIEKLNELTGQTFRLPTEAEWEYAARGGNQSQGYKYAGSNTIYDVAWYDVNSYDKGSSSPDYGTHEVGTKQANELGLYDMSGNVWEWCQDCYSSSYYSESVVNNPQGPSSGSYRVCRGGSWRSNAGSCRVSFRDNDTPTIPRSNLGLRLAL